jgi:hypothetical protein
LEEEAQFLGHENENHLRARIQNLPQRVEMSEIDSSFDEKGKMKPVKSNFRTYCYFLRKNEKFLRVG